MKWRNVVVYLVGAYLLLIGLSDSYFVGRGLLHPSPRVSAKPVAWQVGLRARQILSSAIALLCGVGLIARKSVARICALLYVPYLCYSMSVGFAHGFGGGSAASLAIMLAGFAAFHALIFAFLLSPSTALLFRHESKA
jgi:hypothetical protein